MPFIFALYASYDKILGEELILREHMQLQLFLSEQF